VDHHHDAYNSKERVMFWDDAEGRDELGRRALVTAENRSKRGGLAAMAMVSDEEPGAFAGDAFSFKPFPRLRVERRRGKDERRFPSRLNHVPPCCAAIA
jgi:hypothetical protein